MAPRVVIPHHNGRPLGPNRASGMLRPLRRGTRAARLPAVTGRIGLGRIGPTLRSDLMGQSYFRVFDVESTFATMLRFHCDLQAFAGTADNEDTDILARIEFDGDASLNTTPPKYGRRRILILFCFDTCYGKPIVIPLANPLLIVGLRTPRCGHFGAKVSAWRFWHNRSSQ